MIALFSLIVVLRCVGRWATNTSFNVYLDSSVQMPAAQIGALVAVAQLAAILGALVTPRFVARWGNGRTGFVAM